MVASRKNTKRSVRKNNNYEFRIRRCPEEETISKPEIVKRKSNLYDRFSFDSQQVERRKRPTSGSNTDSRNRPPSLTINAIQEICMVDIKSQLLELTKKVNKLLEGTEARLNQIESKVNGQLP